ncbi:MAG TPA: hypothetical protein VKM55_12580 [Candidatus Lokiarchaeia archaeon]|nr:hypothetical protein [Candidatus Lokiarchaeia archaeon]
MVSILLSIFDTRLGPVSFMAIPQKLNAEIVKKTAKLMDFVHEPDEFFIQEDPEDGIKSINLALAIPSKWARGGVEMAQLSVITTEESPPIDLFKQRMIEFRDKLLEDQDIYMAFYRGNRKEYIPASFYSSASGQGIDPATLDGTIAAKCDKIFSLMDYLQNQVRIDTPTTYAYLTTLGKLSQDEAVQMPRSALNELKEIVHVKSASNVFAVFRKIGDMMKIDLIPCSGQVIKVRIIVLELTPEFIMRTSQVISLPLLFTSGICQEKAGKCSYEAYFSIPGDVDETIQRVQSGLQQLPHVQKVDIQLVS